MKIRETTATVKVVDVSLTSAGFPVLLCVLGFACFVSVGAQREMHPPNQRLGLGLRR